MNLTFINHENTHPEALKWNSQKHLPLYLLPNPQHLCPHRASPRVPIDDCACSHLERHLPLVQMPFLPVHREMSSCQPLPFLVASSCFSSPLGYSHQHKTCCWSPTFPNENKPLNSTFPASETPHLSPSTFHGKTLQKELLVIPPTTALSLHPSSEQLGWDCRRPPCSPCS